MLDATTLAAYRAASGATAKGQAVVDTIGSGTLTAEVRNGESLVYSGTFAGPLVASAGTVSKTASLTGTYSGTGTPSAASWSLRVRNASGNYVEGTLGPGGRFTLSSTAFADGQAVRLAISIAPTGEGVTPPATLEFVVPVLVTVDIGSHIDLSDYVTGGTEPYILYDQATGTLPAEVTLNTATGRITAGALAVATGETPVAGLSYGVTDSAVEASLPTFTLTGESTATYPYTIGQGFVQGDLSAAATLDGVQLNVLATWPDGTVRTAIVSGTASLTAATPSTISLATGTAPSGSALTTADLKATSIAATFDAGAFGSASWSGTDWDSPFLPWATGPIMSSWIYRKQIGSDEHLVAWMEVRLWSTGDCEVLPWIENGYLNVAGPTNKSATYTFTLGTQRFSKAVDLPNHSRFPMIDGAALSYWLGTDKSVTVKHDMTYLMRTELVPAYGATVASNATAVTNLPATFAPLQQGNYPDSMGAGGYHPSIGPLPEWDVLYLTSDAASVWAGLQRNAYSAGRYGVHYRDETTNRPLRFSAYPNLGMGSGSGVSGIGSSTTTTPAATGTSPAGYTNTHSPSMGYMAALVTGRFYHVETTQFLATANYLKQVPSARLGSDGVFDYSAGANALRGSAWAIRSLCDAAAVTPDSDVLQAEFKASMAANADWNHGIYVAQPNNPQGWVRSYSDYTPAVSSTTVSGSTSTNVVLPSGYVHITDDYYNGWELVIGGESRAITDYVGSTRTAVVAVPFTVTTASVPFVLREDNIFYDATWMQDFVTFAFGYALALDLDLGASDAKLAAFFAWKAESVVGRFGGVAAGEFLYRDAAPYTIATAPSGTADFLGGTGPWYANWGEVWEATYSTWSGDYTNRVLTNTKELGDGSLRGTINATSYWGNLQPALSYAVRHSATGAAAARAAMTGAPNWSTLGSGFNPSPVWSVIPLSELA